MKRRRNGEEKEVSEEEKRGKKEEEKKKVLECKAVARCAGHFPLLTVNSTQAGVICAGDLN